MTHRWPVHGEDEIAAVAEVLRSGRTNYWTGENGVEFEKEFAAYTGAKHALAVSSGTSALELAYAAADVGLGDEVIVPARTFIATASAAALMGAKPVVADIDSETLCVSIDTIRARFSEKTKAIVVVHWGGLICPDIARIADFCNVVGVTLIEDCAHAHGAQFAGRIGDIGCFSMCVGKIMSTGGEGGMIITHNEDLHNQMSARRDHGRFQMVGNRNDADLSTFRYTVDEFGSNARMTEMQAAIGRLQLKKLDGWVARRRKIMQIYDASLHQSVYSDNHAGYLYNPRFTKKQRVRILTEVAEARHGGCPNIAHEPAFEKRGWKYECGVADDVGKHVIGLPIYPTMSDEEVLDISSQVLAVL